MYTCANEVSLQVYTNIIKYEAIDIVTNWIQSMRCYPVYVLQFREPKYG